jgi:hypothetical protein
MILPAEREGTAGPSLWTPQVLGSQGESFVMLVRTRYHNSGLRLTPTTATRCLSSLIQALQPSAMPTGIMPGDGNVRYGTRVGNPAL